MAPGQDGGDQAGGDQEPAERSDGQGGPQGPSAGGSAEEPAGLAGVEVLAGDPERQDQPEADPGTEGAKGTPDLPGPALEQRGHRRHGQDGQRQRADQQGKAASGADRRQPPQGRACGQRPGQGERAEGQHKGEDRPVRRPPATHEQRVERYQRPRQRRNPKSPGRS
jgi:hypothetical protein